MNCKTNPNNVCCGGKCVTKQSNNLITWKDPKKSGIALASILTFLFLVKYVNLASLFFQISTFALIISALAEYAGKLLTGTGFVTKFKPVSKPRLGEIADYYAPHVVKILSNVELKAQSLYTSVDVESTFKAGVLSFILYKLTSSYSLWSLLLTATLFIFTVPAIYLANKELIDGHLCNAAKMGKAKMDETYQVIDKKYGPQIAKAKKSVDPVVKMIQSKLPVRTAGTTVGDKPSTTTTTATTAPAATAAATTSSPVEPESATTTSSAPHASETIASTVNSATAKTSEPSEVDFNALGDKLKQEAQQATANAQTYSKEQVDKANPF